MLVEQGKFCYLHYWLHKLTCMQVLQAKKKLLDNLHAEVAESEDGKLKRMLIEDETTLKRREQCTHRLKLLRKAAEELSAASY